MPESVPAFSYALPRLCPRFEECDFYHVMDVPGYGILGGEWDLRQRVDAYLGSVPFAGRRVLEIGPASGFLTFEMEKRGGEVVAVEMTDDEPWDFVPFEEEFLTDIRRDRRVCIEQLKNAWWLAHAAHRSSAKVWYGSAYELSDELGHFDVSVLAAVLLHTHSPLKIVEQCARRTDQLVITELYQPELAGRPVCQLVPTLENRVWDTWWQFSPEFFVQFVRVLGFNNTRTTTHDQLFRDVATTWFTVVATR